MSLLKLILRTSLSGSLVFLMFMLIRPLTKRHFSSSWHYGILVLCMTAFLIPARELSFMRIRGEQDRAYVYQISEKRETVPAKIKRKQAKPEVLREYLADREGSEEKREGLAVSSAPPVEERVKIDPAVWISFLYLAGGAGFLLFYLGSYRMFKKELEKNSVDICDDEYLEDFRQCRKILGIGGRIGLGFCEDLPSPMLVGLLRPAIYLSCMEADRKKRRMIFLHELSHYKRKDITFQYLFILLHSIHWFNPLMFLLRRQMEKYREYAVDELVVEGMNREERKYYAKTILSVIVSSQRRKPVFTTSMEGSGLELKQRLEAMMDSLKESGGKRILSFVLAAAVLASGLITACSILPEPDESRNHSFVVYAKEDGLYYSYLNQYLNAGREVRIQEGEDFFAPLVSESGRYIAYRKDKTLFLYDIDRARYEEMGRKEQVFDNFYSWWGDKLIYADDAPGVCICDPKSGESIRYLDQEAVDGAGAKVGLQKQEADAGSSGRDEKKVQVEAKEQEVSAYVYEYDNFKVSGKGKLYARCHKSRETSQGRFSSNEGIVEIDLRSLERGRFEIRTVVEGSLPKGSEFGYNPTLSKISEDGRYVFIKEKFASGSMSADFAGLGVYDAQKEKHRDFTGLFEKEEQDLSGDLTVLPYDDNIVPHPKDSRILGLIRGGYRELFIEKEAVLMKMREDGSYELIRFMEEDQVAMTPSFTRDGEKLLYSVTQKGATESAEEYQETNDNWDKQPHHICEYELKTGNIRQITEGKDFDYMPLSLSKDEILVLRVTDTDRTERKASLIRIKEGEERIFAQDVIADNYPSGRICIFFGKDEEHLSLETKSREEEVKELYRLRETKIGDNSKVGAILSHMEFPRDLSYAGMKLHTRERPYGLEVRFKAEPETVAKYDSKSHDYLWRTGSVLLFSLIDNLDYVKYCVEGDSYDIPLSYMDRKSADAILKAEKGYTASEAAKSEQRFDLFCHSSLMKKGEREGEIQAMVGYMRIQDDEIIFDEVEIVEGEDRKRIEELSLSEEELVAGYAVVNRQEEERIFAFADTVFCSFTDVGMRFVKEEDGDRLYSTADKEEIRAIFEYLNTIPPEKHGAPVFIEVKDGKVIAIIEKLRYTI
ncbi:MAG: M56 family metallopeptidase [Peptostreptococcaceae bacterium]|nr:M56 family metallopeptidase [Peptostreptococcaceae bacterium]